MREVTLALSLALWYLGIAVLAWDAGHDAAMTKIAERDAWVNAQMENVGFCAWVREASFAQHCALRAKEQETR